MLSRRTRELEELTILLEASEARLNCHRFWRADIGRDLFGDWRADIAFGRIGGSGRTFSYGFGTRQEAKAFVETALKRRRGALRRCGVAYSLVLADTGPDGPSDGDIRTLISGTSRGAAAGSAGVSARARQDRQPRHSRSPGKTSHEASLQLD
jgi:predicted DNA-binding WGR domain protein